MMWFFAILIVLAMGGVGLVAAGRGRPMAPAYDDRPDALVPEEGPILGGDLRRVRFSLAVRGYRMSEVDALLQRLAAQLEETDAQRMLGPGTTAPQPTPHGSAAAEPVAEQSTDAAADDTGHRTWAPPLGDPERGSG